MGRITRRTRSSHNLSGELVEVRHTPHNERLLGGVDGWHADGLRRVWTRPGPKASLVRQGVDQPRLAAGQLPQALDRGQLEDLPALGAVLRQQLLYLALAEISQAQRFGLDVEGAAALHVGPLPAGIDLVVAHIPHAAQDHALRERLRPPVIVRPQLAQYRDQRVADQRIDLVQQQHQRSWTGCGPAHQSATQGSVRAVLL